MLIPMRTRTERTTDQATLTERAVLGLLTRGERSGYDLLKTIEQSVGFFWTPAKSQLYALLPRLVVRGLLKARRVEQDKRPAKTLYRITPAGRGACARAWSRPRRRSAATRSSCASSYLSAQPPRSNPSAPPGSSKTPSSVTNCDTTMLPISVSLLPAAS
jgi:DNA-binding PadR family transcriptional regulator